MVQEHGKSTGRTDTQQRQGNITYGVMPEQAAKQLQGGSSGEFMLIKQARQGEEPQVWSSGDPEQTQALFRRASENLTREPVG